MKKIKKKFSNFLSTKRLLIVTDKYTKTIELGKIVQGIIITIIFAVILTIIIVILISAKFYAKVDSKQRKIDQMLQDQRLAKAEIIDIIYRIDEMNAYFDILNFKKSHNFNNNDPNFEIKEDLQSEQKDLLKKKIQINQNTTKINQNIINSNSIATKIQIEIPYETMQLNEIRQILNDKIKIWYNNARIRYHYIKDIFSYLRILNCNQSSFFKKIMNSANDVVKVLQKFATTGRVEYQEQELLEKMQYRICNDNDSKHINYTHSNEDLLNDKSFIPSLMKLENVFSSIPIGQPVTNKHRFASNFGMRKHPIYHDMRFHHGVDFAGPYGSSVHSTAGGVIIKAGWHGGYGNLVEIQHQYGLSTRYAHLSKINVRVGQKIRSNQLIGKEGSSGGATGSHVHYELHINNVAINPVRFTMISR